jgi:methionine-gamma-lyase
MTFESICVHEMPELRTTRPHILPIYATASFDFESIDQGIDIFTSKEKGHVYSRYANPTVDAVADKIALLETFGTGKTAHAIMLSSGMAAISTLLISLLKTGDTVLTQGNLYGGTTELLQKTLAPLGIQTQMIDLRDLALVEQTLQKNDSIRLLYFETPANPTLDCVDIAALANLAQKYGIYSAVDNTFCTPYLQQPLAQGVDFVVHSTTKYLNGHGNSMSGALVGTNLELMRGKIWQTMKLAGTNCSPFEAWLTHNGMKTLKLRMDKHCQNAQAIAEWLSKQDAVSQVNYPGLPNHRAHETAKKQMTQFGAMLSFELAGGLDAAMSFMNKIKFCTLAPTLGDVDTLVLHPTTMSHLNVAPDIRLANGITDGLVRLSIGIEAVEDIIADLAQAIQ